MIVRLRLADPDSPRVFVPPPLYFVAGVVVGWLLEWVWPLGWPAGEGVARAATAAGAVLLAAGCAIGGWSMARFRIAGTSPLPVKPTSSIVTNGPYRLTRNPMYLALSFGLAGIGLLVAKAWILVLTPVVMFAIDRLVIAREERYLEGKFGEGYLDYKRRVRRWL